MIFSVRTLPIWQQAAADAWDSGFRSLAMWIGEHIRSAQTEAMNRWLFEDAAAPYLYVLKTHFR